MPSIVSGTDILATQLEASSSSTIYLDIEGLDEAGAQAMLLADPPLHVEFDAVRGQWAVRAATPEEVEEATAAKAAAAEPEPTTTSRATSKPAEK